MATGNAGTSTSTSASAGMDTSTSADAGMDAGTSADASFEIRPCPTLAAFREELLRAGDEGPEEWLTIAEGEAGRRDARRRALVLAGEAAGPIARDALMRAGLPRL